MITANQQTKKIYSDMRDAFFEELFIIAKKDKNIILIIGDQGSQSLNQYYTDIPDQIINAGIAEQNMISVAAGLALAGKHVFVYAIASFITLRCLEQIKVDIGIMNLPVTLIGIGVGYAYGSDGPTHHATEDISIMRTIPVMRILSAADTISLANFPLLIYQNPTPTYVRIDKGNFSLLYDKIKTNFKAGLTQIKSGYDLTIISTGIMVHRALEVADNLKKQNISAGVIDLYRINPINKKLLLSYLAKQKKIITLEEHLPYGGIGTLIAEWLADENISKKFKRFSLPSAYCFDYGSRDFMHQKAHLDKNGLTMAIIKWLKS